MLSTMIKARGSRDDLLLAAAFAIAAVVEILIRDPAHLPVLLAIGLLVSLSLVWRVRFPVGVLAVSFILLIIGELLTASGDYPVTLGVASLVPTYSAAAHAQGRRLSLAAVITVAGMLGEVAADTRWDATNVFAALFFGTIFYRSAWAAGRWMQRRRERQRELLAEREEQERTALREERARIARELHDVLAHAISVIVLQARGARHALASKPDDARRAIDAIEHTASQALAEIRRLLAVVRDEDAAALSPQPSLAQIEGLVAQVRAAGLPVELDVQGSVRELPPGVDLCAYRVVQEALTNVLKHAGPATARVLLLYGADALEVQVADTGAPTTNGEAVGLGLAGMHERVAVFGGRLESGRHPDGGYVVSARLPL
jgi:signal transduction histidine kinase